MATCTGTSGIATLARDLRINLHRSQPTNSYRMDNIIDSNSRGKVRLISANNRINLRI